MRLILLSAIIIFASFFQLLTPSLAIAGTKEDVNFYLQSVQKTPVQNYFLNDIKRLSSLPDLQDGQTELYPVGNGIILVARKDKHRGCHISLFSEEKGVFWDHQLGDSRRIVRVESTGDHQHLLIEHQGDHSIETLIVDTERLTFLGLSDKRLFLDPGGMGFGVSGRGSNSPNKTLKFRQSNRVVDVPWGRCFDFSLQPLFNSFGTDESYMVSFDKDHAVMIAGHTDGSSSISCYRCTSGTKLWQTDFPTSVYSGEVFGGGEGNRLMVLNVPMEANLFLLNLETGTYGQSDSSFSRPPRVEYNDSFISVSHTDIRYEVNGTFIRFLGKYASDGSLLMKGEIPYCSKFGTQIARANDWVVVQYIDNSGNPSSCIYNLDEARSVFWGSGDILIPVLIKGLWIPISGNKQQVTCLGFSRSKSSELSKIVLNGILLEKNSQEIER